MFDFDPYFVEETIMKILECKYISAKGRTYGGKALFHRVALVLRIGEDPLIQEIFDKMYFTLFWIKILHLEVTQSESGWRTKIIMNDYNKIELEFSSSPLLLFETHLEGVLKYPTMLIVATEIHQENQSYGLLENRENKEADSHSDLDTHGKLIETCPTPHLEKQSSLPSE